MTTADWALVISILSALTSVVSLAWSIWSKFIYPKPVLRVTFQHMVTVGESGVQDPVLVLSATNHGPANVVLHLAVLGKREWPRVYKIAQLGYTNPIHNFPIKPYQSVGPFSGGLPKRLAVGETFSAYFDHGSAFLKSEADWIGFADTFGKCHWARIQRQPPKPAPANVAPVRSEHR